MAVQLRGWNGMEVCQKCPSFVAVRVLVSDQRGICLFAARAAPSSRQKRRWGPSQPEMQPVSEAAATRNVLWYLSGSTIIISIHQAVVMPTTKQIHRLPHMSLANLNFHP